MWTQRILPPRPTTYSIRIIQAFQFFKVVFLLLSKHIYLIGLSSINGTLNQGVDKGVDWMKNKSWPSIQLVFHTIKTSLSSTLPPLTFFTIIDSIYLLLARARTHRTYDVLSLYFLVVSTIMCIFTNQSIRRTNTSSFNDLFRLIFTN